MIPKYDISVIIVNYNVKDFLLQCLRSIQQASQKLSVQIIVVDNNSTDGSVEFLKPLFPDVSFIELSENIGFGRANNLGYIHSDGKYILILNPDTIIREDTLDVMYNYLENNVGTGIAGCKVLNPDGTFQLACRRGFPTPWASFCKLFGLQSLFPKSKLFAGYNQTFRSIDKTYYIDSVIGAFMFIRREVFDQTKGFDPDYFMYGEDIDLCYRAGKMGWKTVYLHETSIIHYKGESTKRSSINELKHFYEAMEIFAGKHYSRFFLFLMFIRIGIFFRSLLSYLNKKNRELYLMLADILIINSSLLVATKIRFGEFFNFPDYAYPDVFFVITLVMIGSMIGVGEYFEGKPTGRKSIFAMLISFFILSSLTYFFKEYAFSRGILLMTFGFSIILSGLARAVYIALNKKQSKESIRKIAIIGTNSQAENIIGSLRKPENPIAEIAGIITVEPYKENHIFGEPVLGTVERLANICEEYKIHEIIITDKSFGTNELINTVAEMTSGSVKFHIAGEYEDLIASRIINDITGIEPNIRQFNLAKPRYRIAKRLVDLLISVLILIFGSPFITFSKKRTQIFKKIWSVFIGTHSVAGYSANDGTVHEFGKPGIISLADVSKKELLTRESISSLNRYYLQNYTFGLDLAIIYRYITGRKV